MLKPYDSYKDTDIAWLDKTPTHWKIIRNKDIMIEQKDTVEENFKDYTLLSLTLNGIIKRNTENGKGKFPKEFNSYKIVNKNNIIFCLFDIDETPRTVGLSTLKGMITGAYTIFEIKDINDNYLYYYYLSIDNNKDLKPLYTGLRKSINIATFLVSKLPIPPKEEQDQIAKYLDWQTSRINKLINAKKKQIELLKEQKQAIINKAVTKGLYDTVPMKDSGVEWLESIPKHWEVSRLKNGCSMINRGVTPQYTENKQCAMVVNQATFSKSYWDTSKIRYTLTMPESSRGLVEKSDVLLASTGGGVLGKVYYYNEEGEYIADSHVTIIRSNEKLYSKYIYYYFSIKYDLINAVLAQGSTNQTELQRTWLTDFCFPFPPIEEQQKIVDYLDNITIKIENAITKTQQQIDLLSEYKTSLISSVVTGKVDVRDVVIPQFDVVDVDDVFDDDDEILEEVE